VLANAGFEDILIANQVVERSALQALVRAAELSRLAVAVDCARHVELLAAALPDDATVSVLVEIDVGNHRSGIAPGSPTLLTLAETIEKARNLRFVGLQAYEGHAVLESDRALRAQFVHEAAVILRAERRRLERAGFPVLVVSGGGTGTFDLATDAGALTEIQAGSYVLMDSTYDAMGLPFEIALYCCATVVSRAGDRAVMDAGLKAMSTDSGLPRAVHPEIKTVGLADEHMRVTSLTAALPDVGERLLFVPSHIDPTVNLHDRIFAWGEADGISTWDIDGRRRQRDHA
jgi:D-serine deaminase-like pyridoxal phosphate-dependent protein